VHDVGGTLHAVQVPVQSAMKMVQPAGEMYEMMSVSDGCV
jgi:hypothetical protein